MIVFMRRRREAVLFLAGLLLFLAGAVNVFLSQRTRLEVPNSPGEGAPPAKSVGAGRPADEPVAAYLQRKKELLLIRARRDGGTESFAVVSFDSYRTPEETEEFLIAGRLVVKAALTRVPLDGFQPEEVKLGPGDVSDQLHRRADAGARRQRREAEELEKILPSVTSPRFRAVYQEDGARRRRAAELLESGAVFFGAIVSGPHASLAKGATLRGVRLVDLPDDQASTLATHAFRGILPEES